MLSKQTKEWLDSNLGRFISRKLSVWLVATAGLFGGFLTSEQWVDVSVIYIGGQAVIDTVAKLRNHE